MDKQQILKDIKEVEEILANAEAKLESGEWSEAYAMNEIWGCEDQLNFLRSELKDC